MPFLFYLFFIISQAFSSPKRLELELTHGWNWQPWETKRKHVQKIRISTTIDIPKDRPIKGSTIKLSGLWWKGKLWINGKPTDHFTGGLTPIQVPIGELLQHGKNTIQLQIEGPKDISSRNTGGRLHANHKDHNQPQLLSPPILLLRPEHHIEHLWLETKQGKITPPCQNKRSPKQYCSIPSCPRWKNHW